MVEELAIGLAIEAGYRKPLSRLCLGEKSELVCLLTTYHLFIKVKAHMDLFKEGLEHFGMGQYISKYQCLLHPLFVDEKIFFTSSKFLNPKDTCICDVFYVLHSCQF